MKNIIKWSIQLRDLLLKDDVREFFLTLYERKDSDNQLAIALPLVNKAVSRWIEENIDEKGLKIPESLVIQGDRRLIVELGKLGVLHVEQEIGNDETGEFYSVVENKDMKTLQFIRHWVQDADHLVHFGIFSLDTLSGNAFAGNYHYLFDTSKGSFRLFKAFLEVPEHFLDTKQACQIFDDNDNLDDTESNLRLSADRRIKELRKLLKITMLETPLLVSTPEGYVLRPGN